MQRRKEGREVKGKITRKEDSRWREEGGKEGRKDGRQGRKGR